MAVSESTKAKVRRAVNNGMTREAAADLYGVSKASIYLWSKKRVARKTRAVAQGPAPKTQTQTISPDLVIHQLRTENDQMKRVPGELYLRQLQK